MPKILRTKFQVEHITDFGSYDKVNPNKKVKLNAIYSHNKNTEDNQFSSATPSGMLEMMISNPNAVDFFQPGKKYYLDISEAPDDANSQ